MTGCTFDSEQADVSCPVLFISKERYTDSVTGSAGATAGFHQLLLMDQCPQGRAGHSIYLLLLFISKHSKGFLSSDFYHGILLKIGIESQAFKI